LANILRHPLLQGDYAGVFLCGDLNDSPESEVMQWLRHQTLWRIVDCYQAVSGSGPRHSKLQGDQASVDSPLGPNYDYILRMESQVPTRIELLSADYVFNRPDPETGLYPSDHFGVRVQFRIRP
jgi:hypothetical protein